MHLQASGKGVDFYQSPVNSLISFVNKHHAKPSKGLDRCQMCLNIWGTFQRPHPLAPLLLCLSAQALVVWNYPAPDLLVLMVILMKGKQLWFLGSLEDEMGGWNLSSKDSGKSQINLLCDMIFGPSFYFCSKGVKVDLFSYLRAFPLV